GTSVSGDGPSSNGKRGRSSGQSDIGADGSPPIIGGTHPPAPPPIEEPPPHAPPVTPAHPSTSLGPHAGPEPSIAISKPLVGSERLYTSVVSTAPGDKTRIHHHGECETSIYILSGDASYTYGPTGVEHGFDATAGDIIYIPAGEIHVEANASATE